MKKTLLMLSIVCTTTASATVLNGQGCENLTLNKINQAMETKEQLYSKNPFNQQRCVPISLSSNDVASLSIKDFSNSKGLYSIYQKFLGNSDTMVSEIELTGNRIVKMMKLNHDEEKSQKFQRFFKKQEILSAKFEEYSFFHELMHLEDRRDLRGHQVEAIADVGSVLMVTINSGMTMEDTMQMLKEITAVRKADWKSVGHYREKHFRNAKKNLEMISDMDFDISNPEDHYLIINKIEKFSKDVVMLNQKDFMKKYKKESEDNFTFS